MWDDGAIWEGAREGMLILRRCTACRHFCHPPLPVCPRCQGTDWIRHVASGDARVKAWFVSTHPSDPDVPARLVVVVELAEGVRFVSNLLDVTLDAVREDMPVRLHVATVDGVALPRFAPSAA